MSAFVVILLGENIRIKFEDSFVIGFFKAQKVWARNQDQAIEKAKRLVLEEWEKGVFLESNKGNFPDLSVESVCELDFFQGLFRKVPKKGHSFYSED